MSNYKELKDKLRKERKQLYVQLQENQEIIDKYKKVLNAVNSMKTDKVEDEIDIGNLLHLKKYFPTLEDKFNELKKIYNYEELISSNRVNEFDFDDYLTFIKLFNKKYGIPPVSVINETEKTIELIKNIKSGNINKLDKNDLNILIGNDSEKSHVLYTTIMATCQMFAFNLLKNTIEVLENEEKKISKFSSREEINDKIELINKFNNKFTDNSLIEKFTEEELNIFIKLINSFIDEDECNKIITQIKDDEKNFDIKEESINFDTLDMSKFTEEEIKIIEQLRDICEDEDLKEDDTLDNKNLTYNDRVTIYKKLSIECVLHDVGNLLNNIYNNKDDVIKIFKLIIDLYQKYNTRTLREERILELERISSDFNNIIGFINQTYRDREQAYKEEIIIRHEIVSINEYLSVIRELINSDYDSDEYFDNELDKIILKYKNLIKKWKYVMTSYYQDSTEEIDIKENTDNLVFCLNDDINLEKEEYQKEFIGAIESLESKSSKELKMRPGRKGMSRIRKTTENDKSKDFVEYLETKLKTHLHFVPYRYSSDVNYRTGLIKFQTSPMVKEFLETRYGLSKQSAFYGVFQVIRVFGADHSEYHIFEEYIMDNLSFIEDIGNMLSSDKPDYDKLSNVLDKMLSIKHELVNKVNSDSKVL